MPVFSLYTFLAHEKLSDALARTVEFFHLFLQKDQKIFERFVPNTTLCISIVNMV